MRAPRVLLEVALDRVGVGMRVQEDPVLLRELHDAAHHGQVGIGAEDVELADRDVAVALEPLLEVRNRRSRRAPRCRCRRASGTAAARAG